MGRRRPDCQGLAGARFSATACNGARLTPIRCANGNASAITTVIESAGTRAHTYIRIGRLDVAVMIPITSATRTPETTSRIARTPGRVRLATAATVAAFVPTVAAPVTRLLTS